MNSQEKDSHPARREHWNAAYASSAPDRVSWYQQTPTLALELIAGCDLAPDAAIVDVGGGASTLVDALLAAGYRNVSVLDVAATALSAARERLGDRASAVTWLEADITRWRPQSAYDLWHDRAVFHFLTRAADRAAYTEALEAALAPGGHAIIATFAPDGPEQCSGLPVERYSAESLAQELGPGFALAEVRHETHVTPGGGAQAFIYCRFVRAEQA
ncbi:MAG: class I SAM-dependent methyltransferase [Hyphomicrobiales bacterium]|nr:class I SAM-dependent methyltransferase [Hyphomicrobiales bacterium]